MASTAIIVNATDALGKSAQKSVTNVNPAATNAQLVELGQMLTAVSNNTYGNTVRIDKTDCDTEPTKVAGKPVPTLTLTPTGQGTYTITYDGDGTLKTIFSTISGNTLTAGTGVAPTTYKPQGIDTDVIYASETENFAPAVLEFTVQY